MRSFRIAFLAILCGAAPAPGQASRTALTPGSWALTHVNLLPMTSDTVIRNASVVVKDGRIVAAGAAGSVRIPKEAVEIDGRGGYVVPGLADMHTHLYADDHVPDSVAKYELGILLANGVTTARLMIGVPYQLQLRKDVMAGRVVGPQLWSASPQMTGRKDVNSYVVTTPEGARAAVDSAADTGYDFIKITNYITLPVYDAIIAEAAVRHIRVDGHVNPGVGLAHAIASGQHMQHLDGWFEAALADSAPMKVSMTQMGVFSLRTWESLDWIDEHKIDKWAGIAAHSGLYFTPTLALFNSVFARGETEAEVMARPDWPLIPAAMRTEMLDQLKRYWSPAALVAKTDARRAKYLFVRNHAAKALSDSGAKLLAGSDSPDWFMAEGYTLHRELEAMVQAGLTPYQALVTATRNAAEFLGGSAEWGTIAVGRRADLVLLTANPLEDIRRTSSIAGTSIGGRWIPRNELDAMVRLAAEKLNPPH